MASFEIVNFSVGASAELGLRRREYKSKFVDYTNRVTDDKKLFAGFVAFCSCKYACVFGHSLTLTIKKQF